MDDTGSRRQTSLFPATWKLLFVAIMVVVLAVARWYVIRIVVLIVPLFVISTGYQVVVFTTAFVVSYAVYRRSGKSPLTVLEFIALTAPGLIIAVPFVLCEIHMGLMGRYKCGLMGSMFGDPLLLGIACAMILVIRIGVQIRFPRWRRRAIAIMFLADIVLAVAIFLFVPPSPE